MAEAHTYIYRRRLPHYQKTNRPVFVTFCRLSKQPFSEDERTLILQRCVQGNGSKFQLHAAVVMPEHVHLLLTPGAHANGWPYELHEIMRLIKGASARDVNRLRGQAGPVWQDESFDHVLRSEEHLQEKLDYIRMNPVRRGLVSNPDEYSWLWIE
jgi:REP element-mobilizing transposase RayT